MSFTPASAVVWSEIPVTNLETAMKFYSAVFGYEMSIDNSGPNPLSFFPYQGDPGIAGHLYPGKPSGDGTGPTVHFAVPDTVEAAEERVRKAGGQTLDFIVDIPAGRFGYAIDPDGNSIGLFQGNT